MAYDVELADRIRDTLEGEPGITEKRMFGGLAFLVNGNMALAASGQGGLMVRIDPDDSDALVDGHDVTRMEMHGREMDGWLRVSAAAVASDDGLRDWTERGIDYAESLPAT